MVEKSSDTEWSGFQMPFENRATKKLLYRKYYYYRSQLKKKQNPYQVYYVSWIVFFQFGCDENTTDANQLKRK